MKIPTWVDALLVMNWTFVASNYFVSYDWLSSLYLLHVKKEKREKLDAERVKALFFLSLSFTSFFSLFACCSSFSSQLEMTSNGSYFSPALSSSLVETRLSELQSAVGCYILPTLTWVGIVFNLSSIAFLNQKEARMRKSLKRLFAFLNTFDRFVSDGLWQTFLTNDNY